MISFGKQEEFRRSAGHTLGYIAKTLGNRGVMHIGWVIACNVLLLFSAVAISAGTISLLMKRMETRLSKSIRERE